MVVVTLCDQALASARWRFFYLELASVHKLRSVASISFLYLDEFCYKIKNIIYYDSIYDF